MFLLTSPLLRTKFCGD